MAAPCRPTKLNLSLVGTIFREGEAKSLAIIQEKGVEETDIYTQGDGLIGFEDTFIVLIDRNHVVINNQGKCLDKNKASEASAGESSEGFGRSEYIEFGACTKSAR